ncbi:MAG: succinate dehydrogenase cytochrome b subunit [Bacteroidetes bacterium]|nr:succinate dehydrogenase cytochrome b subunit [Bacteroidota bacterium]MBS1978928.1 succinate dehydrogenase cytochrome b subunit [Bacteroidota bacterium]
MKWFVDLFTSTLGRKLLMALTGLFLITFLIIHLMGNLQLLKDDGGHAFNVYAEFMSTNPLIQTVSKVNFFLILLHAGVSLVLTMRNRSARGPVGYAVSNKSSIWSSRNMGILGTLVLVFIVVHLNNFWAQMHWGNLNMVEYDGKQYRDLYSLCGLLFSYGWYVALYVFCMAAIGFHLWHGFASAFQTLGLNHLKYNGLISFVGKAFSIIVPALYALIPVMMFSK